jgi:beta-phosphoglucomutase-like phosphatase (HAD superfamily)
MQTPFRGDNEIVPIGEFDMLIVDLDGTIADTELAHARSYELILSTLTGRDVHVGVEDIAGRSGLSIWADLTRRFNLGPLDCVRLSKLRRIVSHELIASGSPLLELNAQVMDLVVGFSGLRIVLTAQEKSSALRMLTLLGVSENFDEVITGGGSSSTKGKIEVIRSLASRESLALDRILWIEDASPELEAGREAGVRIALVRRSYNVDKFRFADWLL